MININKAGIDDFTQIDGIGKGKAANIIKYREDNNGFNSLEELKEVKGIARKIFNNIKSNLTISNEYSEEESDEILFRDDQSSDEQSNEDQSDDEKVSISINTQEMGIDSPEEVHLVGEMNNWNPEDKTYSLIEKEDGVWSNEFDLEAGTEYKIMYDSTDWEENKYIGDNGANLVV